VLGKKNPLNEGLHTISGARERIKPSLWRRKTKEKMNYIEVSHQGFNRPDLACVFY